MNHGNGYLELLVNCGFGMELALNADISDT